VKVYINKTSGLANDLLLVIPFQEIEDVLLSVPYWGELNRGEGMVRWRGNNEFQRTKEELKKYKVPVEKHLKDLGMLDEQGRPLYRVIAIGNRNLGNNYGVVAWHSKKCPKLFHLKDEPIRERAYSCLVRYKDMRLSIRALRFGEEHIFSYDENTDLTNDIEWCTYGQQILKAGNITNIEDIIQEFYDIRHVLALDPFREDMLEILTQIYGCHPNKFNFNLFREKALEKLRSGIPRNRYLHNCVGLSQENVFILQREGTPEELAYRLAEAGALDAIILDNGGSVGCWVWWVYRSQDNTNIAGGFVFTAPDYRPPATSIIAFKLRGPVQTYVAPAIAAATVI
jgi:hypothetical protein